MFRSQWLHSLLDVACSRTDRRRPPQGRKPVRLMVESLEDRLTPSGPQTAGSYTELVNAIAADTAANTNYVIQITGNFTFNAGGQVSISKLGTGSTLTLSGQNGANFTLTGNGNRLFTIAKGQTVTFENLTLTGGAVQAAGTQFGVVAAGGCILDDGGNVMLSKVAVQDNKVTGKLGKGGGVLSRGEAI